MREIEPARVRRTAFGLSSRVPLRAAVNEERPTPELLYDMHYELELGIVLAGRMERRFEQVEYLAQPGQVWLCGIWEPHGYRVVGGVSRALVIVIRPEMLVGMHFDEAPERNWLAPFTAPAAARPQAEGAARGRLRALAERFIASLAAAPAEQALRQRLLLVEILLTLTAGWQPPAVSAPPAGLYARISAAVELVFARKGLVSAVEAARACGLSRNQFDRLFLRVMRLSFARFALRYRLGGAAQQIVRSEDALKKVAADWGFTDASHLVHGFQQHYGCTPLAYRTRKQAEALAGGGMPVNATDASEWPAGSGEIAWNARVTRTGRRPRKARIQSI